MVISSWTYTGGSRVRRTRSNFGILVKTTFASHSIVRFLNYAPVRSYKCRIFGVKENRCQTLFELAGRPKNKTKPRELRPLTRTTKRVKIVSFRSQFFVRIFFFFLSHKLYVMQMLLQAAPVTRIKFEVVHASV